MTTLEAGNGRAAPPQASPGRPEPRSRAQRRADTEHRLVNDIDLWLASGSADGGYLVPLSFDWDGEAVLVATPADSVTGRNLAAGGTARLALGHTRDVVMIDGDVEVFERDGLPPERIALFVRRAEFDPPAGYRWYRVTPRRIQAWREVNEMTGRELMRDGRWLSD